MLNTTFSPWPCYSKEEAALISDVLLSNQVNYWTGTLCREFEAAFSAYVGCEYAVALANGTLALECALKAIELSPGDEVIVTPRSFFASASSIVNLGGIPVFADVSPDSQNITAESIEACITPKTKAIICVHLAGWPCEMDKIMELARSHNLKVIEDCAQAHGAQYKGKSVGTLGDIAAWSFCQDKIMTTGGEGGMITTNNRQLWEKAWSYKDHGKSWKKVYETNHPPGFRWLHDSFGSNYRMMEIQAALGLYQLKQMPAWHQKRVQNANRIWTAARQNPLFRVPEIPQDITHAAYKCYFFIQDTSPQALQLRDDIMKKINDAGVPCYSGSCPEMYKEHAFDGWDISPKPIAKVLGETSLMLLVHPNLLDDEISLTCKVISEVRC